MVKDNSHTWCGKLSTHLVVGNIDVACSRLSYHPSGSPLYSPHHLVDLWQIFNSCALFEFLCSQRSLSFYSRNLYFSLKSKIMLRFKRKKKSVLCIAMFRFSLFLPSLRCMKKAMQSLGAHPTVGFAGSFSFPGSLTGCQTLQAMYWRGDKHWPALINLLVWLFPILYYNGIHTCTQDTDAYLDQSVLVSSSHSHQCGASTEESASRGEQQWWINAVFHLCVH